MYAEQSNPNAAVFNCYQRAHQNVLENYPQFLLLLGLAAINRPKFAAVAGAIRVAGFVVYVITYRTMVTIELTPAHGLPMAVAICSVFVTTWAGFGVAKARKKYEIKYPQMYAEQSDANAVVFNCYQRAHQNVLENYPSFLLLLGLAAINRPIVAGVAGAIRLAGFVAYVIGYRTGNPEKRHKGAFGYIGLITMLGCAIESAVKIGMS
ncbi:unnamed protein product [Ectocarpus sp. 12 AP-2014]